ncbi:hypothetical protein [Macrococcoides canis]|uniref:hypothetical protein n=1 Tax=Macrococcoides canis TaxID=1855823 RepID=UPI0039C96B7C
MRKEIQRLLDSELSSNKIATLSGVDQSTIHRIRKGERSLDNITLVKAEKLYKLAKELEKMDMNKVIVWNGKNTAGNITYKADGRTYKELLENIQDKYGYGYIEREHAYEIALLEKNNENLEKYEITTDGIINYELFEEFFARTDIKQLDDEDYKDVISSSNGNAYYQNFETRYYFESEDTEKVEEFDTNDFNIEEDENGWYTTDKDEYIWIIKLNDAINKLVDNDVDVESMEVNEYQDYIDAADKL